MRKLNIIGYSLLACVAIFLTARVTQMRHRLDVLEARNANQQERIERMEAAVTTLEDRPLAPAPAARPPAAAPMEPAPAPQAPVPAETADAPAPDANAPGRDDVRFYVDEALREHFPDLRLSDDAIAEAADALYDMRTHREAMRALRFTGENAEAYRQHRAALQASWDAFERATGLSMTQFVTTVTQEGTSADAALDEEPVFEYLSDLQP